jgi:ABC-type multidrug transport system fused ATPase/permease subunit
MRSIVEGLPGYWQDKTIIALSLFLAASPWLAGYGDLAIAQWNAVIIAAVLAVGSAAVVLGEPYWPNFVTAFMAFWLVLSPRILGFSDRLVPTLIAAAVGSVVIVLALWSAVRRSHELLTARRRDSSEPPAQPPSKPTPGHEKAA